jgi:hypothetical protein
MGNVKMDAPLKKKHYFDSAALIVAGNGVGRSTGSK